MITVLFYKNFAGKVVDTSNCVRCFFYIQYQVYVDSHGYNNYWKYFSYQWQAVIFYDEL